MRWRVVEVTAERAMMLVVLLLGAYALGRSGLEVRDGAGYVTTSANVAYAIAAVLVLLVILRALPVTDRLKREARWYALVAIAVHSVGLLGDVYARFWGYDDLLHMTLAGGGALLLVRFAQDIRLFPPEESTPMRAAVLAVVAALAAAGAWEIFEYVVGMVQGTRLQADLNDTMLDMIDGMFGGLVVAAWLTRHPRPPPGPSPRPPAGPTGEN